MSEKQCLMIDPKKGELFESPDPFRRFIKPLVDRKIFPSTPLTIAIAIYPSGAKSPLHFHKKTTEVYFVLKGILNVIVKGNRYQLKEGQLLYIPPKYEHWAENREKKECHFMTINTPLAKDVLELTIRKKWKKIKRNKIGRK